MKTIEKLNELTAGKTYMMHSERFNADNEVFFIGHDYSELKRDIGYFIFSQRTLIRPTIGELATAMKDNNITKKAALIFRHSFALWGWELDYYKLHEVKQNE